MKTRKSFSEWLRLAVLIILISGIITMLVGTIVNLSFFDGSNETWDSIAIIGSLTFITPLFLFQFVMPSDLLKLEIPTWGKTVIYLLAFPCINIWMISAADAAFHFLPDFHAAMNNGSSKMLVQALREEWSAQAWTIMAIAYISMIGLGLICKAIRENILTKAA